MIFRDKVKQETLTFGTDTFVILGRGISKFRTLAQAAVPDDAEFIYSMEHKHLSEWEVGLCRKVSDTEIEILEVRNSSNGGVKVNFSAGVKHLALTIDEETLRELWERATPDSVAAQITAALSPYYTAIQTQGVIASALTPYITEEAVETLLLSYSTPSSVTTQISNAIASYTDTSGMNAAISAAVAPYLLSSVAASTYATPAAALSAAVAAMAAGTNPFSGTTLALTGDITFSAADRYIYRGTTQKAQITATQFNILNSNVGIGGVPNELLDVAGTIAISGARNSYISGALYAAIYRSTTGGGGLFPFDTVGNLIIQPRTNGGTPSIVLATGQPTTPTARLVVNHQGFVGIGQTTPTELLHIGLDGSAGARRTIYYGRGGLGVPAALNTASDGDKIVLYRNTSIDHSVGVDATSLWFKSFGTGSNIQFHVGTTERMRIDSSGTVILGSSTSLGKFSVYGDANGKGIVMRMNATTPDNPLEIQSSGGVVIASINNAGDVMGQRIRSDVYQDSVSNVYMQVSGTSPNRVWTMGSSTFATINLGAKATTGALNLTGPLIGAYGVGAVARPTVTGSRGGNAALASFLTGMASIGWIIDATTA